MEKWTLDQPAAFNFFSSSSSSSFFLFFFASLHFSPRASSSSSFAPSTSPASSSSRCLGGACVGTFPPFGSHRRASPQAGESQQASQSERWKESKRSEAVGPRRPALLSRTTREKNAIIPGGVRYRSHLDRLRQLSCSFFLAIRSNFRPLFRPFGDRMFSRTRPQPTMARVWPRCRHGRASFVGVEFSSFWRSIFDGRFAFLLLCIPTDFFRWSQRQPLFFLLGSSSVIRRTAEIAR